MSGRSSRSSLMHTNSSFIRRAVSCVLERLALHHVAPVAGRVADREQDRPILLARAREGLLAPRVPVDGVVLVLEEVRRGLVCEPVGHLPVRLPGRRLGSTGLYTDPEYLHRICVSFTQMRQASGDLFPTDSPIPASQLIGRRDDVREIATRLEAGHPPDRRRAAAHGQDERVRGRPLARPAARRLHRRRSICSGSPTPPSSPRRWRRPVIANRSAAHRALRRARSAGRAALSAAQARAVVRLVGELGEGVEVALTPGLAAQDPDARSTWRSSCPSGWRRPTARPDPVLRRVPGGRLGAPALRRPGRGDQPDARRLPALDRASATCSPAASST